MMRDSNSKASQSNLETRLRASPDHVAKFCEKHHMRRLAVFGSALRTDFDDASDIDFLVEFEPEHIPGLIRLAGMERKLSALIRRDVDLRTLGDLSGYFRDDVAGEAKVVYAPDVATA